MNIFKKIKHARMHYKLGKSLADRVVDGAKTVDNVSKNKNLCAVVTSMYEMTLTHPHLACIVDIQLHVGAVGAFEEDEDEEDMFDDND